MLLFYPFSGFFTKFTPPLQRIAAASVHSAPPTHLQKNCKKVAKNQPYASARHLCGSLWREPLKGAFEGSLFGPSAGVFGGASARRLCGSCWRSLCRHLFLGGGLLEASARHLLESFWGTSAEPLGNLAGTFASATKNPSSKDGFHTQTLTIQTMQWLNFLLFVSDTKVGQNAS